MHEVIISEVTRQTFIELGNGEREKRGKGEWASGECRKSQWMDALHCMLFDLFMSEAIVLSHFRFPSTLGKSLRLLFGVLGVTDAALTLFVA